MTMNRRRFLGWMGAIVGGVALEQAIPFHRVWSFPKEIKIAPLITLDKLNYAFVPLKANITAYDDFVWVTDLPLYTSIFSANGGDAQAIRAHIQRGWTNGKMRAIEIFE